eukprot:GFKZ01005287.1.p1 GENE.GFKZ01005287.1~~GFKZ01005287.1.p1  ORF type:complete len:644 (-),score=85.18 GFKZ01005287.1:285-2216(-)
MDNQTLGTESNPVITDAVPLSPGTAIVIGAAGSAIVLSQTAIRAWRRVSLSQFRGLYNARMQLFFLNLCLVAAIGAAGAFHFFPDDARALGGLLPVVGVLAPFVFISRRPQESVSTNRVPTRARFLDWLAESPVNLVLMLPGIVLSALCVWGMVVAQSWDVLALSFSVSVAVLTRSDPPLYFAWDGVAPRWQWGRLLPCPTRMPGWRLVVGRTEDENGQVDISFDAMEVPVTDSRTMQGALVGESALASDRSLAREVKKNGAHRSLPYFYDYVEKVWQDIIHGASSGEVKEGLQLDEATASCFLLIVTMLKESLRDEVTIGADVWLLLAILRHRLDAIALDFIGMRNWKLSSRRMRMRDLVSSVRSIIAGRTVGTVINFDNDLVAEVGGEGLQDPRQEKEGSQISGNGIENVKETANNDEPSAVQLDVEDVIEDVAIAMEEDNGNGDDTVSRGAFSLKMFQAFAAADNPPKTSDATEWVDWTLEVLHDLYRSAIAVSKQAGDIGQKQVIGMEDTFREWLGEKQYQDLSLEIMEALEGQAPSSLQKIKGDGTEESPMTQVEEATVKVAEEEAWTFVMLALAREHTKSTERDDEYVFESFGGDLPQGELNGRLKAQNMARKIVVAQIGLWTYVALGQTATALLSR